jgi:hypothetical protein
MSDWDDLVQSMAFGRGWRDSNVLVMCAGQIGVAMSAALLPPVVNAGIATAFGLILRVRGAPFGESLRSAAQMVSYEVSIGLA